MEKPECQWQQAAKVRWKVGQDLREKKTRKVSQNTSADVAGKSQAYLNDLFVCLDIVSQHPADMLYLFTRHFLAVPKSSNLMM